MNKEVKDHFLSFSTYTYAGAYQEYLCNQVPNDIREFGVLIRKNVIHRVTLRNGNTGSNSDKRYGDMDSIPWWRQPEDDVLPTIGAMLTELFRRDSRGFVLDRLESARLIVTCRFVAILTAAVFKSKGIPARVRSGFASYVASEIGKSYDHWVAEFWSNELNRWVMVDVDCCLEPIKFDPFDIPIGTFELAAQCWLGVRKGGVDVNRYWNAGNFKGLIILAWELMYDFHCLMNHEIIYLHTPRHLRLESFQMMTESDLLELDELAELMLLPDENLMNLRTIWEENRRLRLLAGGLL